MFYFLDSGPKFTGLVSPNTGRIVLDHVSFRFWIHSLFPEIFAINVTSNRKLCKICPNFTQGKILGEGPEFFDLHYKADADTDQVTKFRGDRQTELGDPVAN